MRTDELDYTLPPELIAQHPAEQRDASRLLVVDRASGSIELDTFRNLPDYLNQGDCVVLNDSKVIRARLYGRKETGGQVEIFLLHKEEPGVWEALVRPSAKVRPGTKVQISDDVTVMVEDRLSEGRRRVRFEVTDVIGLLEETGQIPLPPYIHRDDPDPSDLTRYQTLHATTPGSVAAPTAGLHFTPEVYEALDAKGVGRVTITLHVGYGTFKPIQAETLDAHMLHSEDFWFTRETAQQLNQTRAAGKRVVAVGTTSARVLESVYNKGTYKEASGETDLYVYPPYRFQAVDSLQTNFHLPRSSLLALVYAFGGTDLIRAAYQQAIAERMRFYSYGDTMLIL
jgi:S-adenosylmethionine:tRNA ribosyltransferase-isomerase